MRYSILFLTLVLISCAHKKESFDDHLVIKGDYIYKNKRAGRVEAESFYKNLFQDDQNRPKVLLFDEFDNPVSDFDGVYIYLDAEARGGLYIRDRSYSFKDKILYLGSVNSLSPTKEKLWLPFALTSFTEREENKPEELLYENKVPQKKYFAAYLASNCVTEREDLYNQLVEFAAKHHLGEVHALGKCFGSHPETKVQAKGDRGSMSYADTAVKTYKPYKFVLCSENEIIPGYVTEKIVNVFLAHSVPIYRGDESVKELFREDKFIFLNSTENLSNFLEPFVKEPELLNKMMVGPYLTEKGIYYLSWHKDIRHRLETEHKQTIKDSIYSSLRRMSLQKN